MSGPVSSARKFSDFASNDGLAKALIESFPSKGWGLKPRSLGTKIGQLDKGNVTWWAKNLDKAECLAQLLEVPLEDFGVHGKAQKGLFHFIEFPEFPPLDLKREESWQLAEEQLDPKQTSPTDTGKGTLDDWLGSSLVGSWRPPYDMDWLCIDDDLQRRLLAHRLSVSGRHEVLFAETLAEAANRLMNPKPLIVSVSHDGGDEDLAALARRPNDAGVLVIAPFLLPSREVTSSEEFRGWEQRTVKGLEGRKFDLTATWSIGGAVKRWTIKKLPDWRERLLLWVEKRLNREHPDTLFSAQGMAEWLDCFDPLAEWFNTTSDVMHLCRLGHLNSEKQLPEPNDFFAGERLVQSLFAREPSSRIFRIKQLVNTRWSRNDLSWQGSLPLETWLSLSLAGTEIISRSELETIVAGKSAKERGLAADRVANLLEAGNPDSLLQSGLLKESQRGSFDFQHRTLAGLLVRDGLMRQIAQDPPGSWATNCFDPERRPLVDAALNAMAMECIVNAVNRLEQVQPGSAEVIGASEALFMAIGRRIARGEIIPATLFSVARNVVERLELSNDGELTGPWSRPIQSRDEQLEWVGTCWAWSLIPDAIQSLPNNWLFPGLADSLPEAPYWINSIWQEENCEQVSLSWMRFFGIVDQWVKDLEEPITNAPPLVLLGFLRKSAHGLWKPETSWWEQISGKIWAENALVKRLKEDGSSVAARLWPSYLEYERGCTEKWRAQMSPIRYWLLDQMKPAEVLGALNEDDLYYLASIPETLPPEVRGPLLQSLGSNIPVWPKKIDVHAGHFFARFGRQIVAVLPDYLAHDDYFVCSAAADYLWLWDAPCAKRLLLAEGYISFSAKKHLLENCPANYLLVAIEALLATPSLLDLQDRNNFVRERLPSAGAEAASLLSLLRDEQVVVV